MSKFRWEAGAVQAHPTVDGQGNVAQMPHPGATAGLGYDSTPQGVNAVPTGSQPGTEGTPGHTSGSGEAAVTTPGGGKQDSGKSKK